MTDAKHQRTLVLARHSKSSWKFPDLDDHDRPLNKRGQQDAPLMAERLATKGGDFDCVISSTALRANSFAKSIALRCDTPLEQVAELYTFSAQQFITCLRSINDNYRSVVVVGHNPAITAVASYLADSEFDNIPTSGVVSLRVTAPSWQELTPSNSSLIEFDYPKRK